MINVTDDAKLEAGTLILNLKTIAGYQNSLFEEMVQTKELKQMFWCDL